jgi:hypothetical protein
MDSRIKTIAEALHELQATGKYTVFYDYSGQINSLDVNVYEGDWQRDKKPVIDRMFNLDRNGLFDMYKCSSTTVEEFLTLLKSLKDNV